MLATRRQNNRWRGPLSQQTSDRREERQHNWRCGACCRLVENAWISTADFSFNGKWFRNQQANLCSCWIGCKTVQQQSRVDCWQAAEFLESRWSFTRIVEKSATVKYIGRRNNQRRVSEPAVSTSDGRSRAESNGCWRRFWTCCSYQQQRSDNGVEGDARPCGHEVRVII